MTCAFAVRGALKKLPGVDTVEVSLSKGLAAVKLKPGNAVSVRQLWELVKTNGFTPKETRVVARGELVSIADRMQLKTLPGNQLYELDAAPSSTTLDEAKRLAGRTVTIEGTLTPSKDLKSAAPIQLQSIRP